MVHHGLCTRSWKLGSEKAFDWVDWVKIVSCFRGDHGSKLRLEATRSSLRSLIQFNPFEVAGFLCCEHWRFVWNNKATCSGVDFAEVFESSPFKGFWCTREVVVPNPTSQTEKPGSSNLRRQNQKITLKETRSSQSS